MRKFIVYSATASTAPFIKDLKAAGRHDILLHSIISALFASNTFRKDVELHLILMGPPNSPRHIVMKYADDNSISKKNLKKTMEIALRKYGEGETREVHPGVFIDNKSIYDVVEELAGEGNENGGIFVLDGNGNNIKNVIFDFKNDIWKLKKGVFILGDHDGFDKKTKKFLKKNVTRLSLGPQIYFTSQAITIINYELDNL
ncbi:MAG: hypothetical protein KC589_10080 [Nanoarchaeota archaeon]|nr:hypothetical protein [Nanoarchaeota archaeon]